MQDIFEESEGSPPSPMSAGRGEDDMGDVGLEHASADTDKSGEICVRGDEREEHRARELWWETEV